ncbi:hypothetical protein NQ318_003336 [Aromia moschata]|uniref:Amidase domain-containing protein n=1 Tax=Aromia moschata TaxID=1265417 RepID=A0AAV8XIX9_9CUCU|nr:hypothetical protein NQ318_003336 [Aromia moschata]
MQISNSRTVSIKGHYPYCYDEKFKDALVLGPMTRYAKDLRLMMKILLGDKLTTQLKLNQRVDLNKLKVYFMEDNDSVIETRVDPAIKSGVRTAVKYLKANFQCQIIEHKFKEFQYVITACAKDVFSIKDLPNPLKGILSQVMRTQIWQWRLSNAFFGQSQYSPHLLNYQLLLKVFETLIPDHSQEVAALKKTVTEHLGENGILLYPTNVSSATKHNEFFFTASSASYAVLANSLGCPATNVPCGFDKNGMPIGIQVIASPNQDRLCLAVAEELEKCFGGWMPPK